MGALEPQHQQQKNEDQKRQPTIFRVDRTHYQGLVPEFINRNLESVLLEYPECFVQSLYDDRCDPLGVEIKIAGGIIGVYFEKCVCTNAVFFSNE